MIKVNIQIKTNADAVHMVESAMQMPCDVDFSNGRRITDAKSLLGVLSSDFSKPCVLSINDERNTEHVKEFLNAIKDILLSVED